MRKLICFILMTGLIATSTVGGGLLPVNAQENSSLHPIASLKVDPATGWVGLKMSFDASDSIDSRGSRTGLQYRFNFSLSDLKFTNWSGNPKTTYTYDKTGPKTVILELKDQDGLTDRTSLEIQVSDKPQFSADIDVSPTSGNTETQFRFKALISKSAFSAADDYLVRYDFEGDGKFDTEFSNQKVVYFTYGETGYKTPTVEVKHVKDGTIIKTRGVMNTDDGKILVADSDFPRATLKVTPTIGYTESTFYIDASNSFTRKNQNLLFRFDVDSDGVFDSEFSSNKTISQTYATPGIKKILVQIKDSDGMTDQATTSVLVRDRDLPPSDLTIRVERQSSLNEASTGTVAGPLKFTANARDDKDQGRKMRYRFDFDNDGKFDTTYSSVQTVSHRYLEPGNYTVLVEAMDTAGNTKRATTKVKIIQNTAPMAKLTVDQLVGTTATEFRFRSNSTDNQSRPSLLESRFDFNNDGVFDTKFQRGADIRHKFSQPGIKTVVMQVRDSQGAVAIASQQVEVLTNSKPNARLLISPQQGDFSTSFELNANLSSDGQTSKKDLQYRFDTDYQGPDDVNYDSTFSRSPIRKTRFRDKVGVRKIRVEVKDENGEITTAYGEIELHWAAPYLQFLQSKGVMTGGRSGFRADAPITRAELATMILKADKTSFSGYRYKNKFKDVKSRDWFSRYVEKSDDLNILTGYSDKTFRPFDTVSRAEVTEAILKGFKEKMGYHGTPIRFSDVPSSSPYADSISKASALGLIGGYGDGRFQPNKAMTRGEVAKVLTLAMQKIGRVK